MIAVDPWHKPTDAEEIARYQDQAAGLKGYLAEEAALTPLEQLDEDVETVADRHSAGGWGFIFGGLLVLLTAAAVFAAHGCQ